MKLWRPQVLIPNVTAGLITGLLTLTYSVSYAALIFSGDLSPYLSIGVSSALVGAVVLALIVAWGSSLPFIIAGPDGNAAAILALIATTVSTQLMGTVDSGAIAVTIWVAILGSTFLTGGFLWLLGRLRLGRFIRFIPYPVVGGFLAGVGLLLAQGAIKVMTGVSPTLSNLPSFFELPQLLLWLPGLALTLVLKWALGRFHNCWTLPSILLGATLLVHGLLRLLGLNQEQAIAQGWLLEPVSATNPLQTWQSLSMDAVQWSALWSQTGSLLTLFAVVAITILLCATSIEMATDEDMDFDQELRVAGIANLVTGGLGGMVGHLSVSRSLLNREAGATHRLSGMVAAGFCAGVAIWGSGLFAFLPKAILGGLLLYLGLGLLIEWVYDAYFRLSWVDYGLVLAILLIGARFGFLAGVGVGLLVACLLFVITYSSLQVIRNRLSGLTYPSRHNRTFHERRILQREGNHIQIFVVQGYLFFGTAYSLLSDIRTYFDSVDGDREQYLVLDFRLVSGLDSSAINSFVKMKHLAEQVNAYLLFTDLSPQIEAVLRGKQGAIAPDDPICYTFPNLDAAIDWCEAKIIDQATFRRKRFIPFAMQLEEFFTDPDQVRPFMQYLEKIRLPAGESLFQQGDPANALYFIETGQISTVLTVENGKTKPLQTSGPGTIVGEIGLYGQTEYAGSGVADKPTTVYKLSQRSLTQMQQEQPAIAAEFHQTVARILASRLNQAVAGVEKLMRLQ
ncbi:SulP family inorganic anion transporter [Leptolyngbya iicbica]|uniref:STAS domain-containing protein n=2 Tax=Cyanophyceae TaxID=3028117 RepID=A0A4Q7EGQ8_9CYAN|nr:SulP family inorganic anion transporter [Leptolyngbya sp. LK]RZM82535.1 STAS domain-containing protein [Leptolyngbya sp. LK]